MKDKLRQLIKDGCEYWSVDELKELLNDIDSGADNMRDAVAEFIDEIEGEETNICAVCGEKVKSDDFILIFGPHSFRKQANFCAIDCMEYFLGKLKSVHNKKEFVKQREDFLE